VNCRVVHGAWSRRTTSNLVPAASGRARDALGRAFRMALNVPENDPAPRLLDCGPCTGLVHRAEKRPESSPVRRITDQLPAA
jgi:hypothetical protein